MKKIFIIAACALAAVCCSKYEASEFTGSTGSVSGSMSRYLFDIADNLVVDNLKEVERALASDDPSIWTPGVVVKNDRDNTVKGLMIKKEAADSVWTLTNSVEFPIEGNYYPTEYSMEIKMLPGEASTYHDWEVTLSGNRTEQKGYSCEFESDPKLTYRVDGSVYSWHSCYGTLRFFTKKDGKLLDEMVMVLEGSKADAVIRRTF